MVHHDNCYGDHCFGRQDKNKTKQILQFLCQSVLTEAQNNSQWLKSSRSKLATTDKFLNVTKCQQSNKTIDVEGRKYWHIINSRDSVMKKDDKPHGFKAPIPSPMATRIFQLTSIGELCCSRYAFKSVSTVSSFALLVLL